MKVGQTAGPLRPARVVASTMGWPVRRGTAGSESAASCGPRRRVAASYETTNPVLSKEASSEPPLAGPPTLFSHDHYSLHTTTFPTSKRLRPTRQSDLHIAYWAAYIGVFELPYLDSHTRRNGVFFTPQSGAIATFFGIDY
jgi:hypothetical protein